MFEFIKSIGSFANTFSGAASLLSAGASIYSGITQAQAAKDNAKLAKRQANDQAAARQREVGRLVGSQRASYAAAGVAIDEDTPGLFIQETRDLGQQDVNNILSYGNAQAKAYKKQGRNALIGSGLGAAGSLLGGYGQNQMLKKQYGDDFGRIY